MPETQATEDTTLTADAAKEMLLKDQQQRAARCQEEIGKILEHHRCSLEPRLVMTNQSQQLFVQVVPNGP